MAFCTNCGAKLEDGANFCPKCGAPVDENPQTPKASPAPEHAPAAAAASAIAGGAWDKLRSTLICHPKAVGIAVLAVVILLVLSQCAGDKGSKLKDQIQGTWAFERTVKTSTPTPRIWPDGIGVTEYVIQLKSTARSSACPMSEAEYKEDGLYFSAEWYDSIPINGEVPGNQRYDLRLIYNKKDDLLTLEVEVSGKWYATGEYNRVK